MIRNTLLPIFCTQLTNLSNLTVSRFNEALSDGLKRDTIYDFAEVVAMAKESGLDEWDVSTREMLKAADADGGGWAEHWEGQRRVLFMRLGPVEDFFREKERTKVVNQLEVRTNLFGCLGYYHAIGTDIFGSFSVLYGCSSWIPSKLS
jgi:hypothetical protein